MGFESGRVEELRRESLSETLVPKSRHPRKMFHMNSTAQKAANRYRYLVHCMNEN
jgi:hypothetical protein